MKTLVILFILILVFPVFTIYADEDGLEPNNTLKQATHINPGEKISSTIFPKGDHDCFRVDVPDGTRGVLVIDIDSVPEGICPAAELYDAEGGKLALLFNSDRRRGRAEHEVISKGAFFVVIRDGSHGPGERGWSEHWDNKQSAQAYTLKILFRPVQDRHELNENFESACKAELGKPISGAIFPRGDKDWYCFGVPAGKAGRLTVNIDDVGKKYCPYINLWNSKKQKLGSWSTKPSQPLNYFWDGKSDGKFYVEFIDGPYGTGERGWSEHFNNMSSELNYRMTVDFREVDDRFEPNDKAEQASLLEPGRTIEGAIYPKGDQDWFRIELPGNEKGQLRVKLTGVPPAVNPFFIIRNEKGVEIGRFGCDDDQPLLWNRLMAGGVYYIQIADGPRGRTERGWSEHYNNRCSMGFYSIRADWKVIEDTNEPNDDFKSASRLVPGETYRASVFPIGDNDFYVMNLPQGARGVLTVNVAHADTRLEPYIILYNEKKKRVGQRTVPNGVPGGLVYAVSCGQKYYLQICDGPSGYEERGWSEHYNNQCGSYELKVNFAAVNDSNEPNDKPAEATPLRVGKYTEGKIFPAGDIDCYSIELTRPGRSLLRVLVEDIPRDIHPVLELYDKAGKRLYSRGNSKANPLYTALFELDGPGAYILCFRDGPYGWNENGYSEHNNNKAAQASYRLSYEIVSCEDPGEELDHAEGKSRVLELEKACAGTIFPTGDRDTYSFRIDRKGKFRLVCWDYSRSVAPRLVLKDKQGKVVRDSRSMSRSSLMIEQEFEPGEYCLIVSDGYGGVAESTYCSCRDNARGLVPYKIRIEPASKPFDIQDAHSSAEVSDHSIPGSARKIDIAKGEKTRFRLFPEGDIEWFDCGIVPRGELTVICRNNGLLGDPVVEIYARDGEGEPALLRRYDTTQGGKRGGDEAFVHVVDKRQRIMIKVSAGTFWSDDFMSLTVSHKKAFDDEVDSRFINEAETVLGRLWPDDDNDVVHFKAQRRGRLWINCFAPVDMPVACRVTRDLDKNIRLLQLVGGRGDYDMFAHKPEGVRILRETERDKSYLSRFRKIDPGKEFETQFELSSMVTGAVVSLRAYCAFDVPVSIEIDGRPISVKATSSWSGCWRRYCSVLPRIDRGKHRVVLKCTSPLYLGTLELQGLDPQGEPSLVFASKCDGKSVFAGLFSGYDVVVVEGLTHPYSFFLDLPTMRRAIENYVETGGRFIVVCPQGFTYSELDRKTGAAVVAAPGNKNDAFCLLDSGVTPWSAGTGEPCELVFSLPGKMPTVLSSIVITNRVAEKRDRLRNFSVALSLDGSEGSFREVGSFTCPQPVSAYSFSFRPVRAAFVRLTLQSNYGGSSVSLSQVEMYGPFRVNGFFGLSHESQWRDNDVVVADGANELVDTLGHGSVIGWNSADFNGVFYRAEDAGFSIAYEDRTNPGKAAVTLVKRIGSGRIIMEAQELGYGSNRQQSRWKVHNLINYPDRFISAFTNDGVANVPGEGSYSISLRSGKKPMRSFDPYRLEIAFYTSPSTAEPNDKASLPMDIATGKPVEDSLFPTRDTDWFRFDCPQRGRLKIALENKSFVSNPVIELFSQTDLARPLARLDNSRFGYFGAPEAGAVEIKAPGLYLLRVSDYYKGNCSKDGYVLTVSETFRDPAFEENDTPGSAVKLNSGEVIFATVDPIGDKDWFYVEKSDGPLDLTVDNVPDDFDPVLELRRDIGIESQSVRLLYLVGQHYKWHDLDKRLPGEYLTTRVESDAPEAAKVWDRLDDYTAVIADGISRPDEFSIFSDDVQARIVDYVKKGGRFVLLSPALTFSELLVDRGAAVVKRSGQWDNGKWKAENIIDGRAVAGNEGYGWCCARGGAKFPQEIVFAFPKEKARTVDRVVFYNTTQSDDRRVKDFRLSSSTVGPDRGFSDIGPFTAARSDEPQVFPFKSRSMTYLKLEILSNYGSSDEIQFGELAVLGPSSAGKIFGVTPVMCFRGRTVKEAQPFPDYPEWNDRGKIDGFSFPDTAGWFTGWKEAGFKACYVDSTDPAERAVTLVRHEGQGVLALDMQTIGARGNNAALWKIFNLLSIPNATIERSNRGQGPGGRERILCDCPAGRYFIEVSSADKYRHSRKPYSLKACFNAGTDITTPRICGVWPPNACKGISPKTVIRVNLSEPLSPGGRLRSSFRISGGLSGAVPFDCQLADGGRKIVLKPARAFQNNELVTVSVDPGGIEDLSGKKPEKAFQWSFTTGSFLRSVSTLVLTYVDTAPPFGLGVHKILLRTKGSLARDPRVSLKTSDGRTWPVSVLKSEAGSSWTASLDVTKAMAEGAAVLNIQAIDQQGDKVAVIGQSPVVSIDTSPPPAPSFTLTAAARANGNVELQWPASSRQVKYFALFRGRTGASQTCVATVDSGNSTYMDNPGSDGAWVYSMALVDEAGNKGPRSPGVRVETDSTPPAAAPKDLEARVTAIGRVQLSWTAMDDTAHYYVYRSTKGSVFDKSAVPLVRLDSRFIRYDDKPSDGDYEYRVACVDKAGNIGPCSKVSIHLDTHRAVAGMLVESVEPSGVLTITAPVHGRVVPGTLRIRGELSEALKEGPSFDFLTVDGVKHRLSVKSTGGTTFSAQIVLGEDWPDGPLKLVAFAVDLAGNSGLDVNFPPLYLDRAAPTARISVQPVRACEFAVYVTCSEPPASPPALVFNIADVRIPVKLGYHANNRTFRGVLRVKESVPNAEGIFRIRVVDLVGRVGTRITDGEHFFVDTTPPEPPVDLSVLPGRLGRVRLGWNRPPSEIPACYRVYRSETADLKADEKSRVADRVNSTSIVQTIEAGRLFYFCVTALDRAGNESKPSRVICAQADVTPPSAPAGLTRRIDETGRLRLRWSEPAGEAISLYRVYCSENAIKEVGKLKPVAPKVEETFYVYPLRGQGVLYFAVTAVDMAGNEGPPVFTGPVSFDVSAPVVTMSVVPSSPSRGRAITYVNAGKLSLSLKCSEPLSSPPVLLFRTPAMAEAEHVRLEAVDEVNYHGEIEIADGDDGPLNFRFTAVDRHGNETLVLLPRTRYVVDTRAPVAVTTLEARPVPGGMVSLRWSRPDGEAKSTRLRYKVFRSDKAFSGVPKDKPLAVIDNRCSFTDKPSSDGRFYYMVVAVDEAGNTGKGWTPVTADADATPPPAPGNLRVSVDRKVRLSWSALKDTTYLVYRRLGDGPRTVVAKVRGRGGYEDVPDADGVYAYEVVAVDASGNRSLPSGKEMVDFTGKVPSASIRVKPPSPARGPVRIDLSLNVPVSGIPSLSFVSAKNKRVSIFLSKADDSGKLFHGSLQVDDKTGDGEGRFEFSAKSRDGVLGLKILQGATLRVDTSAPSARISISPSSPLKPGPVDLIMRLSEETTGTPELFVTCPGRPAEKIPLAPVDALTMKGSFRIPADAVDGKAFFDIRATDLAGNAGGTVTCGRFFTIDTRAPKPPACLRALSARHGYVELAWDGPAYSAAEPVDSLAGFRIFCSKSPVISTTACDCVVRLTESTRHRLRPPEDGLYYYAVATVDAAGWLSALTTAPPVVSRRTPPPPPLISSTNVGPDYVEIGIKSQSCGRRSTGVFNVYARLRGGATHCIGRKVASSVFRGVPPVGGEYFFTVTELDEYGNESGHSEPAVVTFRKFAPTAAVSLQPGSPIGPGGAVVTLSCSRPLSEPPRLVLWLADKTRTPVSLEGPDAEGLVYKGRIDLPENACSGRARFTFRGKAVVDGKAIVGAGISSGEVVMIDTSPPSVSIRYPSGVRKFRGVPVFAAGTHEVFIEASEVLARAPRLSLRLRNLKEQVLGLEKTGAKSYKTRFNISSDMGDTDGHFIVEALDLAGNRGDVVTRGVNLRVDTKAPRVVSKARVAGIPGGKVRVEWTPSYFEDGSLDRSADRFEVFRSTRPLKSLEGVDPYRVVDHSLGIIDHPTADATYYYAVRAVDRAGNKGEASGWAGVAVDRNPPEPPVNFAVRLTKDGVVELSWDPAEGEKPLYYNAYLSKRPILTRKGLRPLNERIPFTRVYGTPKEDGVYYFAVTAVDSALNESEPSVSRCLDYKSAVPLASFEIEPDIWLTEGDYTVRLHTSEPLGAAPRVEVNSEHGDRFPVIFTGEGDSWLGKLRITGKMKEGTYGFTFRGRDRQGNVGSEIEKGPLFYVDKQAPLPPDQLKAEPDDTRTEGAIRLSWRTPKRSDKVTEVPYFYNIYRSRSAVRTLDGLSPIGVVKVEYRNKDDYSFTDVPPDNGTWYYAVTSLDLARNVSEAGICPPVVSRSGTPRAEIALYTDVSGKRSTERIGIGRARVELRTSVPLAGPPVLEYELSEGDDKSGSGSVELRGKGRLWHGFITVDRRYEYEQDGRFHFSGTSVDGKKGTFIAAGAGFVIDTIGPVAEIILPSIAQYKVNIKTNKLETPPLRLGRHEVLLKTHKPLARPPELSYSIGKRSFEVPLTGFGMNWKGWIDVGEGHPEGKAVFSYAGVDRAGNKGNKIAPLRKWYDTDDGWPNPRVLRSYCTCPGAFSVDVQAPDRPWQLELERKKLGVAVIKWKEPKGGAAFYRLYRDLVPITSVKGKRPIKDDILAPVIVDAPPCDGNWFYVVTALDLAGNEGPVSKCVNLFIDSIKPELKIKPVPQGDDFFIVLDDEQVPPGLSLTLNFPGGRKQVKLGGTSGELKIIPNFRGSGKPAVYLPQKVNVFNGRVEVIVHSPDPDGNIVESKTEIESKTISPATGGTIESVDQAVSLEIPPGLEPVVPKGPGKFKRVVGYDKLFFITHANIPEKRTPLATGTVPKRTDLDPLPPGLEVVSAPYTVNINYPPEEPMTLKASATQADLSALKSLTAKLRMKIPEIGSEAIEDVDYLKSRLKVLKWVPATKEKRGKWQPIPDEAIVLDPENKELIVPANDVTTYVIVSEKTPPSIRDLKPADLESVLDSRPEISALIVDKGTGVAVGAENRIVLRIDGKPMILGRSNVSEGDPTEVRLSWKPAKELTSGMHVVTVEAEDVVGNRKIVKWRFTIDNEPPRIERTWIGTGDLVTCRQPLFVAWASDPGGSIDAKNVELRIAGRRVAVRYLEKAGMLLARPKRLPQGVLPCSLVVHDHGGKKAEKHWNIRVDTIAPAMKALVPADGAYIVSEKPFNIALSARDSMSAIDLASVRLYIDGKVVQKAGTKNCPKGKGYSFDPEGDVLYFQSPDGMKDGRHRVYADAADRCGNTTSVYVTFDYYSAPTQVNYLRQYSDMSKGFAAVRLTRPETVKEISISQGDKKAEFCFDRQSGALLILCESTETLKLTIEDVSRNVIRAAIDPGSGRSWILSVEEGESGYMPPGFFRRNRYYLGAGVLVLLLGLGLWVKFGKKSAIRSGN